MYRPYRENPSFSSSLLDEIYRSIDQRDDQEVTVFQKTTKNKQSSFASFASETALFDQWVEPVTCKKAVTRKQSPPDFKTSYNSSSSSSDSSCGGGFSSSETESVYGFSSKPKPIRTTTDRHDKYSYSTREKDKQCNCKHNQKYQFDDFQAKPKHEGGKFVKTKSRAMKIYGDLKKVKQPISPGGRLATFLNSIFATNNTKNTTTTTTTKSLESKSANASTTCSSASSYTRSCLSKTPSSSSRGKLNNTNMKRSVRFYLDTEPCDIFGLNQDYNKNDKTRQVEEAARNLLRNYQKKVECEFELSSNNVKSYNVIDMKYENDDEDDDDDDVASHASSDLFELENLSAIGMGKYGDELPVYETTHLDMNLAIGNGFLM